MQKINQESKYPDLGQDKWDCNKHVEEGREDKYCTTWLVGGATGGQGGTFQLFARSPSCSVGRRVCKKELKEVGNAFWLPPCHKPSYTGSHV